MQALRWLYHLAPRADLQALGDVAPRSLATEGFVHCSYRDAVIESARLHFAADADLVVLQIDPRSLGVPVEVAATPRGPMPHVRGVIPRAAIHGVLELAEIEGAPDGVPPDGVGPGGHPVPSG